MEENNVKRGRGRPVRYTTEEDKKRAKLESNTKRREAKREENKHIIKERKNQQGDQEC